MHTFWSHFLESKHVGIAFGADRKQPLGIVRKMLVSASVFLLCCCCLEVSFPGDVEPIKPRLAIPCLPLAPIARLPTTWQLEVRQAPLTLPLTGPPLLCKEPNKTCDWAISCLSCDWDRLAAIPVKTYAIDYLAIATAIAVCDWVSV